jgi:hypothetical protein
LCWVIKKYEVKKDDEDILFDNVLGETTLLLLLTATIVVLAGESTKCNKSACAFSVVSLGMGLLVILVANSGVGGIVSLVALTKGSGDIDNVTGETGEVGLGSIVGSTFLLMFCWPTVVEMLHYYL